MDMVEFPVIDPVATGENILRLRQARGLTVRDLQSFFGFEEPQAIYKWQKGKSLPSVDNLCALGALLGVSMEDILVLRKPRLKVIDKGQQTQVCCPLPLPGRFEYGRRSNGRRLWNSSAGIAAVRRLSAARWLPASEKRSLAA